MNLAGKKIHFAVVALFALILATGQDGVAQQNGSLENPDAFTFVRIRWEHGMRGLGMRYFYSNGQPPWSHDYPTAERNLYTAMNLLTKVQTAGDTKILDFSSDEIFEYPVLYICEIGIWQPKAEAAQRLGEYLKRGGFMIVDDFRGRHELWNLTKQLEKAVPDFTHRKLTADHPIFHCFFEFNQLVRDSPYRASGYWPEYYGWFDPRGRLVAIVNYNNDIGDGWEWPEQDEVFSAEAFRLGINYIVYSLTH